MAKWATAFLILRPVHGKVRVLNDNCFDTSAQKSHTIKDFLKLASDHPKAEVA